MRTLAIGDIHGCNLALANLLKAVQPTLGDRVVFLGDYIDRGPGTNDVIEILLRLDEHCQPIFLCGNHEVMMLEARKDPLKQQMWEGVGGMDTVLSYGVHTGEDWVSAIPKAHWAFIEKTGRFLETETHIFVHAGLDQSVDMSEQPDWILFWGFFDGMRPHKSGKRVICGHTPQHSKPADRGFAVCIDTGAVFGGWLTCLDTGSGKFWQTNEQGETREGKL